MRRVARVLQAHEPNHSLTHSPTHSLMIYSAAELAVDAPYLVVVAASGADSARRPEGRAVEAVTVALLLEDVRLALPLPHQELPDAHHMAHKGRTVTANARTEMPVGIDRAGARQHRGGAGGLPFHPPPRIWTSPRVGRPPARDAPNRQGTPRHNPWFHASIEQRSARAPVVPPRPERMKKTSEALALRRGLT